MVVAGSLGSKKPCPQAESQPANPAQTGNTGSPPAISLPRALAAIDKIDQQFSSVKVEFPIADIHADGLQRNMHSMYEASTDCQHLVQIANSGTVEADHK